MLSVTLPCVQPLFGSHSGGGRNLSSSHIQRRNTIDATAAAPHGPPPADVRTPRSGSAISGSCDGGGVVGGAVCASQAPVSLGGIYNQTLLGGCSGHSHQQQFHFQQQQPQEQQLQSPQRQGQTQQQEKGHGFGSFSAGVSPSERPSGQPGARCGDECVCVCMYVCTNMGNLDVANYLVDVLKQLLTLLTVQNKFPNTMTLNYD